MRKLDSKTLILDDGLRYKSKSAGSPFRSPGFFANTSMSCFLCGKHRTRALMTTRKILGKSQAICAPSCKDMDLAILAANTA